MRWRARLTSLLLVSPLGSLVDLYGSKFATTLVNIFIKDLKENIKSSRIKFAGFTKSDPQNIKECFTAGGFCFSFGCPSSKRIGRCSPGVHCCKRKPCTSRAKKATSEAAAASRDVGKRCKGVKAPSLEHPNAFTAQKESALERQASWAGFSFSQSPCSLLRARGEPVQPVRSARPVQLSCYEKTGLDITEAMFFGLVSHHSLEAKTPHHRK
ncbi:hypothetical protein UY3_00271 [Chelonia mydas]|uniref:Uncharacterized protein n=1 Tax=Chelonia mydas TaxID=8469 RepID=M7BZ07_CHEMY|nr:hypothetical protein UY3_00271 [Chelonia mydas]